MSSPAEGYRQVIGEIIKGSPNNQFANFFLRGRIDQVRLHTFTALYPTLSPSPSPYNGGIDYKCYTMSDKNFPEGDGFKRHVEAVHHDILQLQLPARVLEQQEPADPEMMADISALFAAIGAMPIAFIGLGETARGKIEEVAAMWHIRVLTSQTALSMIQAKIQSGHARGN